MSLSRRALLSSLAGAGLLALGATGCSSAGSSGGATPGDPDDADGAGTSAPSAPAPVGTPTPGRVFGAEAESHARTFMCWPASEDIWGSSLAGVRQDIAGLARAIGGYEPVVLFARPGQEDDAQQACGSSVQVVPMALDDLWARDTLPVFVRDSGTLKGVTFNFNGWGNKQQHANDSQLAAAVLTKYGIPRITTPVVAEGGAFETDGQGTLLVTESSVVNDNRNPGRSRDQIEAELKTALGVSKVIWLAGVRGKDITDAHVDCLARFVAPGVVLLDQPFPGAPGDVWSVAAAQAKTVLSTATDAHGRPLQVIALPEPDPDKITGSGDAFVSSYINFYVANGAVFMPKFGDTAADHVAQQIIGDHFPNRDIVALQIDNIAAGGGGIHCSTHDQPGTPAA